MRPIGSKMENDNMDLFAKHRSEYDFSIIQTYINANKEVNAMRVRYSHTGRWLYSMSLLI